MKQAIQNHFNGNYLPFYTKYIKDVKHLGADEHQGVCIFCDAGNTFNFNINTGGYYCHGCNKRGSMLHFYAKIKQMDDRRDFGKILRGIIKDFGIKYDDEKPKIKETYDYTDKDGKLIYQVVRMEPKTFRQRQPYDNEWGWVWNLKGVERIIYNLPKVLESNNIFIFEGEKDCDAYTKEIGYNDSAATTSPLGAGKWLSDYNQYLKDKNVYLVPDNDVEGKEHMVGVGQSIGDVVQSIKWIDLPEVAHKGDLSDYLDKHTDKIAAFNKIVEQAKVYTPIKTYTDADITMTVEQLMDTELPEYNYYLYPWLTDECITLIAGWRNVGKTWFGIGIADAITKGISFGPWECREPATCMYVDGEMTLRSIRQRFIAINNRQRKYPLYLHADAKGNEIGRPKTNLTHKASRDKIYTEVKNNRVKVLVLDNLASLTGGIDENNKKDWDPINEWLIKMRSEGISTIMMHHLGKEGKQRGTSAREDNIDTSIFLQKPTDYYATDGARFITHFTKNRIDRDWDLIGDMEFTLEKNFVGEVDWTWVNVKSNLMDDVVALSEEGKSTSQIAEITNLSLRQVQRKKREAMEKGLISK